MTGDGHGDEARAWADGQGPALEPGFMGHGVIESCLAKGHVSWARGASAGGMHNPCDCSMGKVHLMGVFVFFCCFLCCFRFVFFFFLFFFFLFFFFFVAWRRRRLCRRMLI